MDQKEAVKEVEISELADPASVGVWVGATENIEEKLVSGVVKVIGVADVLAVGHSVMQGHEMAELWVYGQKIVVTVTVLTGINVNVKSTVLKATSTEVDEGQGSEVAEMTDVGVENGGVALMETSVGVLNGRFEALSETELGPPTEVILVVDIELETSQYQNECYMYVEHLLKSNGFRAHYRQNTKNNGSKVMMHFSSISEGSVV